MIRLYVLSLCIFTLSHSLFALTLEELLPLDESQLDELYRKGTVPAIPAGESRGEALLFPGKMANTKASKIAAKIWKGKIFDPISGVAYNRIFGKELVPGKLYYGESWFDGGPAIILDYTDTANIFSRVRDELREISPRLLLGRAHIREGNENRFWVYFALDFNR